MEAVRFIQMALNELNRSLVNEVRDLTPEQMTYRPASGASTIAFLTWHLPRVEDGVFHRVVAAEPRPPLWEREGWQERFGLTGRDSGTGFTAEQVGAFAPEKELLLGYAERVAEVAMEELLRLDDDALDRVPNPDNPRMTVGRQIQSLVIGHGYWHLGEIRFIKGLLGMPFPR